MKKKLLSLVLSLFLTNSVCASAEYYLPLEVKQSDIVEIFEDSVTISLSGLETDGMLTTMVTGPDYTYDDFCKNSNFNKINHIDQGNIVNGNFETTYKIKGEPGEYSVSVLDDFGNVLHTDKFLYGKSDGINEYTTTRTAPWMVNYHLTTQAQLDAGYKGGEGGQLNCGIAISPSNENIVLLGTDTSGIYKSEDGGRNWRSASLGFSSHGITDLEFYPDDSNIAFAMASSYSSSFATKYEGLYRSEDAGETWEQVLMCDYNTRCCEHMAFGDVDQDGNKAIYVSAEKTLNLNNETYMGGVFLSTDKGRTWTNIGLNDRTIYGLYYKDNILYAVTDNYLYVYRNNSWSNINTFKNSDLLSIVSDGSKYYCNDKETVYVSNDGLTWSVFRTKFWITAQEGSISRVVIFGNNIGILTNVVSNNFFYSTNGGWTFKNPEFDRNNAFYTKNTGYFNEGIDVFSDGSVIISIDGELYKGNMSDNKLILSPSSSGLSGVRAADFLFNSNDSDEVFIASIDRGMIKTTGQTDYNSYLTVDYSPMESYSMRYDGELTVNCVARDPRNEDRILITIGSWGNSIIKESTDGGETYTDLSSSDGNQPRCLEFNSENSDIIYAGNRVSYDNGETWTPTSYDITAISPFNPNKVYGVSGDYIYYSEDAGRNWSKFSPNKIFGIQRMIADNITEDKLWVGTFTNGIALVTKESILYKNRGIESSDGGILTVFDISQDPQNPEHFVAGGVDSRECTPTAGLFESYDGGENWHLVEGLTGSRDIWRVEFHPTLPRVYIGTSSGTFVYEYKKYDNSKLISLNTITLKEDSFTNYFDLWSFLEDKKDMVIINALYSSDGRLKDIYHDNRTVYKNLPVFCDYDLFKNEMVSGDYIKQFIWGDFSSMNPLTEAKEY